MFALPPHFLTLNGLVSHMCWWLGPCSSRRGCHQRPRQNHQCQWCNQLCLHNEAFINTQGQDLENFQKTKMWRSPRVVPRQSWKLHAPPTQRPFSWPVNGRVSLSSVSCSSKLTVPEEKNREPQLGSPITSPNFTALCRYCGFYKLRFVASCVKQVLRDHYSTAWNHFVTLVHILVIPKIFQYYYMCYDGLWSVTFDVTIVIVLGGHETSWQI
jgi:hypothetical protein